MEFPHKLYLLGLYSFPFVELFLKILPAPAECTHLVTGSRPDRVLHFLLLSCNYSCHRLLHALGPAYSSPGKCNKEDIIPSKQVIT